MKSRTVAQNNLDNPMETKVFYVHKKLISVQNWNRLMKIFGVEIRKVKKTSSKRSITELRLERSWQIAQEKREQSALFLDQNYDKMLILFSAILMLLEISKYI